MIPIPVSETLIAEAVCWAFDPFAGKPQPDGSPNEALFHWSFYTMLREHNMMFVYLDDKHCIVY